MTADEIVRAHAVEDAAGEDLDTFTILDRGLKNRELVSAEASDRIGLTHATLQPLCHFLQQRIAGGVPKRIVDRLEAVEIDQQQREFVTLPARSPHRGLDLAAQQNAVRETRQRVMMRHMRNLFFVALALADVGERADEASVREADAAYLEHGSVRPRALVIGQDWNAQTALDVIAHFRIDARAIGAELATRPLMRDEIVEFRPPRDKVLGQAEQLYCRRFISATVSSLSIIMMP